MNVGSLTFASPELLLALLLVPIALVAYLLLQRRRNRYVVRFTNVALLENLVPRRPAWRRHVPTALYLAAIAVLGIALARPSLVVPVPREEATVVLTMDTLFLPPGSYTFRFRDAGGHTVAQGALKLTK